MWTSFVSKIPSLDLAIEEAIDSAMAVAETSMPPGGSAVGSAQISSGISADPSPDLALVFCSSSYSSNYEDVVRLVRSRLPSITRIVGCTGYGVIGGARTSAEEVEDAPGISITLARLPGVSDDEFLAS